MTGTIDLSFLKDRAVQRRMAMFVLAFAAGGAVYAFLAPKWYRSTMTVVPVKAQRGGGISSLLGGELGNLASGFESSMTGGSDAARIAAVLQSTSVVDGLIEKFDLKRRYGEKLLETTREEVLEHCSVRLLPKPNLVQVSCEDKDPRFAQEMVEYLRLIGNEAFVRVNVSSASEEVRTLERRVVELRKQADDASSAMRDFQEKHQIVDLETQAKAVVSSVASLQAQRMSRQMELDYARRFASSDEARARQLQAQLSVMDEQLRDLEEVRDATSGKPVKAGKGGAGMFPGTLEVPALRAEYEKLYRNRKVAETTLVFALDRLEGARAAEARDVSTFVVLDPPSLPTRKSRPSRLFIILSVALVGGVVAFASEWWRFRRRPA